MRKGFDQALARALKTTRQILFVDYVKARPEDATVRWAGVGGADEQPFWQKPDWAPLEDEKKLQWLLNFIGRENRRYFVGLFTMIAEARWQQQLREMDETFLAKLEAGEEFDPPLPPHMTPDAIKKRRSKR